MRLILELLRGVLSLAEVQALRESGDSRVEALRKRWEGRLQRMKEWLMIFKAFCKSFLKAPPCYVSFKEVVSLDSLDLYRDLSGVRIPR